MTTIIEEQGKPGILFNNISKDRLTNGNFHLSNMFWCLFCFVYNICARTDDVWLNYLDSKFLLPLDSLVFWLCQHSFSNYSNAKGPNTHTYTYRIKLKSMHILHLYATTIEVRFFPENKTEKILEFFQTNPK